MSMPVGYSSSRREDRVGNSRLGLWRMVIIILMTLLAGLLKLPSIRTAFLVNELGLRVLSAAQGVPMSLHTSSDFGELSGEKLVFLALAAKAQGLTERAINYLDQATQSPSARPVWWLLLADLYNQTQQLDKERSALGQIEGLDQLVFNQCRNSVTRADLKQAKRWCSLVDQSKIVSTTDQCLLAQYHSMMDQFTIAESILRQATAQPDVNDDCLYQYGALLARQQRYEEAEVYYKRAFAQNPSLRNQRGIASVYAATKRLELAINIYHQAYAMNSRGRECAESLFGIGEVYYYYYQDYSQAVHWFKASIACDPEYYPVVYYLLANSEKRLGHPDEAVKAYRVLEERLAGSTYLLPWRLEYAAYLLELERVQDARQVYLNILEDAPDDPVAKMFVQEH